MCSYKLGNHYTVGEFGCGGTTESEDNGGSGVGEFEFECDEGERERGDAGE